MTIPKEDTNVLLDKLRHPLASIRKRAVKRLLSKLGSSSLQLGKFQLYTNLLHALCDSEIADDALTALRIALSKQVSLYS